MAQSPTPESHFDKLEPSALSPANVVAGISFSTCKMLRARIFACAGAQLPPGHRLEPGAPGSPMLAHLVWPAFWGKGVDIHCARGTIVPAMNERSFRLSAQPCWEEGTAASEIRAGDAHRSCLLVHGMINALTARRMADRAAEPLTEDSFGNRHTI